MADRCRTPVSQPHEARDEDADTDRRAKRSSTRSSAPRRIGCPAPSRRTEVMHLASTPAISSPSSPLSSLDALAFDAPPPPCEPFHHRLRSRARTVEVPREPPAIAKPTCASPVRITRSSSATVASANSALRTHGAPP
ncbi:hypothetical protein KFE25_004328 [Diacronema lutheri]|uniref:Uncharacterized protein n=1 Tax=Diacronema lutheri TaxID=2081491 RepID=A0A8J6C5U3_DIALT|nr:hypothetical protein KFE25_004328 [Diacronema lutheri]